MLLFAKYRLLLLEICCLSGGPGAVAGLFHRESAKNRMENTGCGVRRARRAGVRGAAPVMLLRELFAGSFLRVFPSRKIMLLYYTIFPRFVKKKCATKRAVSAGGKKRDRCNASFARRAFFARFCDGNRAVFA